MPAKRLQSESLRAKAPEPVATYPYNDPGLDALGFLRAVQCDQHTELHHRLRAAEILLQFDYEVGIEWQEGSTYVLGSNGKLQ